MGEAIVHCIIGETFFITSSPQFSSLGAFYNTDFLFIDIEQAISQ